MGDLNREIIVKLTIEGKEANATLKLTDDQYKGLIKTNKEFQEEISRTSNTSKQMVSNTSSMNQALGQFGWVLSDADMFLVNFQMGMRSIGNNIPMVVQGFIYAKQEAASLGTTVGKQLVSSLTGPAGLLLAVNGVMLLLQLLPKVIELCSSATSNLDEKINKLTKSVSEEESKIRSQQFEFNALINSMQDATLSVEQRRGAIERLKEKYPDYISFLKDENSNNINIAESLKKGNDEFERKIKLAASEKVLKEYYNAASEAQYQLNKLEEDRKKIQKQINEGNKARGFSLYEIETDIEKQTTIRDTAIRKANEFLNSNLEIQSKSDEANKGTIGARKIALENLLKSYEAEWSKLDEKDVKGRASLLLKIQRVKDDIEKLDLKELSKEDKKTYEDKLKANLDYYDELVKNDIKYLHNYKKFLDEQRAYYKEHEKQKGGITKLSGEEIKSINEIDTRLKDYSDKYDLSKIKSAQPKPLLPNLPKELTPLNDLTTLRNESGGYENEKQALDEWYDKAYDKYEEDLANHNTTTEEKALLDQIYYNKLNELDDKALQNKINNWNTGIDAFNQVANSIFSIAQQSAMDEIGTWKTNEEKKLDEEHKAALSHAKTQKQRERIDQDYEAKKNTLNEEADKKAKERLLVWFRLQQAASIAQATISTYRAASEALGMPPWGPWNYVLMAGVIAAGLANVASIAAQKMPGYARGGAIVGENGPEIIAPFQDYASGQSKLINMTMMTLRDEIRSGNASHYVYTESNNDYLKSTLDRLNKKLDEGIDARAYLDDRQAKKIYLNGSSQMRKSKI